MIQNVLNQVEQQGYTVKIVPIEHAGDLEENINGGYRNGTFDEELYQTYLKSFIFNPPESLPQARSIIVMAVPQSPVQFTFQSCGKPISVVVPATYLHAGEVDKRAEEVLSDALAQTGYKAVPARIPKKLLAACSGLATYGRNNITYVPGIGSYHRLAAFFSDMPCEEADSWHEPVMLERCKNCRICVKQCPSKAITTDRFIIHAEKCIVFHNEKPAATPFPDWIDNSWHNALVGCMLCQQACPENKPYAGSMNQGATFTEEETEILLSDTPLDKMPVSLRKKLEESDLVSIQEVMARNLRVLLQ